MFNYIINIIFWLRQIFAHFDCWNFLYFYKLCYSVSNKGFGLPKSPPSFMFFIKSHCESLMYVCGNGLELFSLINWFVAASAVLFGYSFVYENRKSWSLLQVEPLKEKLSKIFVNNFYFSAWIIWRKRLISVRKYCIILLV